MTEYDKYKKDRQELIDSRKIKVSTPDGGAGTVKEEYNPIVPTTFKEKWDNYWYHYKLVTFGIALAVILVSIFIYQMVTKPVYDASLSVVSYFALDGVSQDWNDKLTPLLKDYDKNGKSELEISTIQIDPRDDDEELESQVESKDDGQEMNPQLAQANMAKLAGNLSLMENFLYIVDDKTYKYLKDSTLSFIDLSTLADPEHLVGNDKYSLKGTNLSKKLDTGEALDKMYICFVDYSALSKKIQEKKNVKAGYEKDYAFLKSLLEYK